MAAGAEKVVDKFEDCEPEPRPARRLPGSGEPFGSMTKRMTSGFKHSRFARTLIERVARRSKHARSGQALVEFTLIFGLLLVVLWIPADFGLAFFTGQLASNASREGARIGSADPNYAAQAGTCVMPACYSLANGTVLKETARRMSSALLPGATITASALAGPTCNQNLTVTVSGTYNYFFFRLLHLLGVSGDLNAVPIERETTMRWEHQC